MQRNNDFKKRPFKGKRHRREEFYLPGCGLGVKIPDGEYGTLEKGLRYLKRQLKDSDTMLTLREKRYYTKPSMKRRVQKEEAIRDQQYRERIKKGYNRWHPCWTAVMDGKAQ